jgi:hypothetical protein
LSFQILCNRVECFLVLLLGGHRQQVVRVGEPGGQLVDRDDDRLEKGALASERLGAFRIVPDCGILKLAQDLGQTLLAVGIVKDTP